MTGLKYFSVFYINMMYSAIGKDSRAEVIEKCYWPLLELIDKGVKLTVQVSGLSLEIINSIDPAWVKKLSQGINENKCEFIGNGYSQIIAPLFPYKLNINNQLIGLDVYQDLLGVCPQMATVNEMAYSSGAAQQFINSGYSHLMMEWNNPRRFHPEWAEDNKFHTQTQVVDGSGQLDIVWIDSIVFQKLQRYIHGDIDYQDYISYINRIRRNTSNGYLCLYASDTEIFDYRPRRYNTEAKIGPSNEWKKLEELFVKRFPSEDIHLELPSEFLADEISTGPIELGSPENPVPVKKQDKYNLYRWALTGRNDLEINTKCNIISNKLTKCGPSNADWKELLFLCSSDFRTHIEDSRWLDFTNRLTVLLERYSVNKLAANSNDLITQKDFVPNPNTIRLHEQKRYITVESPEYKVKLDKNKGLAIKEYHQKNGKPGWSFGTLEHGWYDLIDLSADFFSGHTVIEIPGEHKITDLTKDEIVTYQDSEGLQLSKVSISEKGSIETIYSFRDDCVVVSKNLKLNSRFLSVVHPFHITINPENWDNGSLYFECKNGGTNFERFYLKNHAADHSQSLSHLISSKYGIGASEGILVIGDKNRKLIVENNTLKAATMPQIIYREIDNSFFLRVKYTAQEIDETFKSQNKDYEINAEFKLRIIANN